MRKIALAATLLALAGIAFSDDGPYPNLPHEQRQNVVQTCAGSQFIYNVGVSSVSPTAAVTSSTAPFHSASVQNLDTTANLYWSYSANVSTFAPSALTVGINYSSATSAGNGAAGKVGYKIAPQQIITFALLPGVTYYMLNDSATKIVNSVVGVCQ